MSAFTGGSPPSSHIHGRVFLSMKQQMFLRTSRQVTVFSWSAQMQPSFSLLYLQLQRLDGSQSTVITHYYHWLIQILFFAYSLVYFIPISRLCMLSRFSHVRLFVTLQTVACHAPLSMGFSRQEYGDLPNIGIKPHLLCLLHWEAGSLPLLPSGKPNYICWVGARV